MIIKTDNFSLKQIADSGQCFRMKELEDGSFEIIARDKYLRASQEDNNIDFQCSREDFESFWLRYFDLDTDYKAYIDSIDPEDKYLQKAAYTGSGIRILNQDMWEMIVTFLISQQNNIKRIKKCIENICENYGELKRAEDGTQYRAFPMPEAFAGLNEDALMECNLGYRSKYVVRTANEFASGKRSIDIYDDLDYEEARTELLKLYGVGNKVADCICLFAGHYLDAFPIDTHIKQILEKYYPEGFPYEKYENYLGVMQQYMFYYDLFFDK